MDREVLYNRLCVLFKNKGFTGSASERMAKDISEMIPSDVLRDKSMTVAELNDIANVLKQVAGEQ